MLAASFLFVLSLSAVEVEIDGINYLLIDNAKQANVIYKTSNIYTGTVVIPESVEYEGVTYAVTSIMGNAFYICYGLTSVTIPNSVTSIGYGAFYGCNKILTNNHKQKQTTCTKPLIIKAAQILTLRSRYLVICIFDDNFATYFYRREITGLIFCHIVYSVYTG